MTGAGARQWVIAGVGLSLLVGCTTASGVSGGSGSGGSGSGGAGLAGPDVPVDPPPVVNPHRAVFLAANTARSDLFELRRSLDNTEEEAMPGHGEVVYSGFGSVGIETATSEFIAIGAARITADFRSAELDGTIDNFFGRTLPGTETPYAGALIFTGETGGAAWRDNRFLGTVTGTLAGPGRTLLIDSDLSGGFRGEAYEVLFGTTDDDNTIRVNGAPVDATVQIIAER